MRYKPTDRELRLLRWLDRHGVEAPVLRGERLKTLHRLRRKSLVEGSVIYRGGIFPTRRGRRYL